MAKKSEPFVTSIQEIKATLLESDFVPLDGGAPPFEWEAFTESLKENLSLDEIKIEKVKTGWEDKETYLSNFGDDLLMTSVTLPPLTGTAYFLYSKQDLTQIYNSLFGPANYFVDKEAQQALRTFFELHLLQGVEKGFGKGDWALRIQSFDTGQSLPKSAFAIDVKAKVGSKPLVVRVLVSKELMDNFAAHYAAKKPADLDDELAEKIPLELHLEMGEVALSEKDFSSIKKGDFVLLDRCLNDPDTGSGKVKGCLEDKVLFIGSLSKDGSITIT